MAPSEQELREARHMGVQFLGEAVATGLPPVLARMAFREYLKERGIPWPGEFLHFTSEGKVSDADLPVADWLKPWPNKRLPTVH